MTEIITMISDVFAIEIATLGTTAITLGFMAAVSIVFSLALGLYRRISRR